MPNNIDAYLFTKDEVLQKLDSTFNGLTDTEAKNRLNEYGKNLLTAKNKISPFSIFISQFKNILTLILIASAILILFIYFFGEKDPSDLIEAGLIITIVIMIAILGFVQEYKAEKAVENLKKMLAFKAKVKRDGRVQEIDVSELVPGDIVILEEGQKVPADLRLIENYELKINESSLTGESNPVSKIIEKISDKKQISDQKNMVFSGSAISSGRGIGVVINTGDKTEIGKIAQMVAQTDDDETPIQKRLNQIGKVIGLAVLAVAVIVFLFIVFFAGDYQNQTLIQRVIHSFIASVALAVAAIPEGLPAVVTIALALGTQRMLKKNTLVRKLNSVETLGSVDVICSDKTGTLTKGEMTVTQIYFDSKHYQVSGTGYQPLGKFSLDGKLIDSSELEPILKAGLYCNNAQIETEKVLGDPTEAALLVAAFKSGLKNTSQRLNEIPFSSERKKMTVIIRSENQNFVYQKGAVEEVLKNCDKIFKNGKIEKLTQTDIDQVLKENQNMSQKALRNLGFAYKLQKNTDLTDHTDSTDHTESDLIFLGIQGMYDPPRIEVKPLIDQCTSSGIRVIMITGDHLDTAKAVATEIGITGNALSGEEVDKLSDDEFIKAIKDTNIFARINPSVKMRIVDALKKDGHIVSMTGDGVNDAPALKKADIGVAMGITGTDVAKEASDMVLLDDKFSTIVAAIEEGRGIFHNIKKFVSYLLSCNLSEVMIVFIAVIFFKELPLTATMLLWINVVTDGFPAVALGMDTGEKGILKYSPKEFQSEIIDKLMWIKMAILGTLLTVGTITVFYLNLPEGINEAKGAAFTTIVVLEMVALFLIRANYKNPFFSNIWLILAVGLSLGLQLVILYVPFFANIFNIHHIDLKDWLYIATATISIILVYLPLQKILNTKFSTQSEFVIS